MTDMACRPATDEQIMVMWRLANGHTLRFARLLELYHGIGGTEDANTDKDIVSSRTSCGD